MASRLAHLSEVSKPNKISPAPRRRVPAHPALDYPPFKHENPFPGKPDSRQLREMTIYLANIPDYLLVGGFLFFCARY